MIPNTQGLTEVRKAAAFESDDAVLDGILSLPVDAPALEAALPRAVELACSLGDWSVGRFRRLDLGGNAADWRWHIPAGSSGFEALTAFRAPPSEHDLPSPPLRTGFTITTLGSRAEDPLRRAAHDVGLRIAALLVVEAEGRPAAAIELFGPGRADAGSLRLMLARLEQIAGRDRSHAAVARAAAYVRARTPAAAEGRAALATTEETATPQTATPPGPDAHGQLSPDTLYDPQTGFARGALVNDRLALAIRRRRRGEGATLAVLLIDPGLDTGSVEVGATTMARRLLSRCRDSDSIAHVDDRDFLVIAEDLAGVAEAHGLARRIAKALGTPTGTDGASRPHACRIGVVIGGPAYDAPADLLRDARYALDRVPASGGVEMFDAARRVDDENLSLLESEMRRALGSREFFVEYQPVVALADGRITGLEAFVRWQHPQIGRIPPAEFIVAAEASPLIHELGDWIIDTVCDQIGRWDNLLAARTVPAIDINVSQVQLLDPGFADRLIAALRRHDLSGERLRLDVNENDLMDEPERCAGVLARLRDYGVRSVIDDFGTGFSSLGLLHTLPVSGLKIDGSFVREAGGHARAPGVARTIIELARLLGLEVIAEGVETREQFHYLRTVGCQQAQGRHFAGPVGAATACDLIRDGYPLDLEAPLR